MTKKQWEDYCIKHIKEHGNRFTVFWATSNKFIANAMDRLNKSGRIKVTPLRFPISKFIIKESEL